MRYLLLITFVLLPCSVGPRCHAGPFYLVTASLQGRDEAGIFRLQDRNGDGDALDVGENVLWTRGMANAADVRRFGPTAIMAADPTRGQLTVFQDLNGDGDALDVGEAIVWANDLGGVFGFDVRGDHVLAADFVSGRVYRLHDSNGDGDALDVGERTPFAQGIDGAISLAIRQHDVVALSFDEGYVHQLRDTNGDGDALDSGENVPYTPRGGLVAPAGLLATGDLLFVSDRGRDRVFTAGDLNGDGDALDIVELLTYSNSFFSQLNGPWGMTPYHAGGMLLVENLGDRISLLRDVNGDGDALDIGEGIAWARGLRDPIGILQVPEPTGLISGLVIIAAGMFLRRERGF